MVGLLRELKIEFYEFEVNDLLSIFYCVSIVL